MNIEQRNENQKQLFLFSFRQFLSLFMHIHNLQHIIIMFMSIISIIFFLCFLYSISH